MHKFHLLIIGVLLTLAFGSCQSAGDHQADGGGERVSITFPDTSSLKDFSGEQLAYVYCQHCHDFPEPGLLTKEVWKEGVLPRMAQRLGLKTKINPYRGLSYYEIHAVNRAGIFPKEKKITQESWDKLIAYYNEHAPDSMIPPSNKPSVSTTFPFFEVKKVALEKEGPALTTMVHYNTATAQLWIGNRKNQIVLLDKNLQIKDTFLTESPPVKVAHGGGQHYLLTIGIMDPSDDPRGRLTQLGFSHERQILADQLPRPVDLSVGDLNQDRQPDFVIAGFGNYIGRLSWFDGTHEASEHLLVDSPGAVKTAIHDFNQDGLPDIMALMAQGDERIIVFYNQGDGNFTQKTVLRFPPVHGSSYFDLADFNQDGAMDILYANGDNADYSSVLKNYHGIRIFTNQGNENFRESYFFPMNGATKAKAKDFDQDGDLDIAAIAYFADFVHAPEEGFIYLKNNSKEDFNFAAYTFSEAKEGRWLTFDTGDVDQDGDEDIILGSFTLYPMSVTKQIQDHWLKNKTELLILSNQLQ